MITAKITKKIVAQVAGFGIIPLLAVVAIVYHSLGDLRQEGVDYFAVATASLGEEIDKELSRQYMEVVRAANEEIPGDSTSWYQSGKKNPGEEILNRYVASSEGSLVAMFLDPSGRVIAINSRQADGLALRNGEVYGQSMAQTPWFRRVRSRDFEKAHDKRVDAYEAKHLGVVVMPPGRYPSVDLSFGRKAPRSIVYATEVRGPNGVMGYWMSAVDYERVESLVARFSEKEHRQLGVSPSIQVRDAEGNILFAHNGDDTEGSAKPEHRLDELLPWTPALMEADPGEVVGGVGVGPTGKSDQVYGFIHLQGNSEYPGVPWSLSVEAPASEVFAHYDSAWTKVVLAGAFALPLLMICGVLVGRRISSPIIELSECARPMADGDFSGSISVQASDEIAVMGKNLNNIAMSMSRVLGNVKQGSMQIMGTSSEISGASTALADNASVSAAALEEISASMATLSHQTKLNADHATEALELAQSVSGQASQSNQFMEQMVASMDEISLSSERIGKIIQVIDDIAFQTNLLALNAAVEAARAGSHGKGFAVVAEEVRTLAARSAKAAKETTELIEDSLEKVEQGTGIARQTAQSLSDIVTGIVQVSDLMTEVASASTEQAGGISEINLGLVQVDNGVQGNTASAEHLAASARELSSRANELGGLVLGLRFREGHGSSDASDWHEESEDAGGMESFDMDDMAEQGPSLEDEFGF